jgi:hypothetical protein
MLITVVTLVVVAPWIGGRRPHQDSSCLRRRLPRGERGRGDRERRDDVSILGVLVHVSRAQPGAEADLRDSLRGLGSRADWCCP